jgi:hypothetical protein
MEHTRCLAGDDDATLAPVLGANAVQNVEPLYATLEGAKAGLHAELRGATVVVAALPGMTAEWLDRALECHSAKEAIGHASVVSADPFWLPVPASTSMSARHGTDSMSPWTGFSPEDARQILARASAFLKSKSSDTPQKPVDVEH